MSKVKHHKLRINEVSPATNAVLSTFMIVMAFIFVAPLLLVISISFSGTDGILQTGYRFIPAEFTFDAYKFLYESAHGVGRAYLNTIFYSVVGTAVSLFVMSMFAFVLSRKDFKYRNVFAFYAYFTTLFGGGLVPSYILYTRYLQIANTIWIFLLPGLVSAFNVIILRTFINSTIDDSLLESARLDGAGDFTCYLRIVMPLFKPGLASVGMFTFVGKWNEWFTGLTYVSNVKLQPIMTYLQKIQKNMEYLKADTPGNMGPEYMEALKNMPSDATRMAITVIAILPLLICYPFFQKYFIRGLTIGGVKG